MSSFCLDSAFWFRVHIQVTLHVLMVFWQEHRRAGGVFVADHIPRVPNEEESSFFFSLFLKCRKHISRVLFVKVTARPRIAVCSQCIQNIYILYMHATIAHILLYKFCCGCVRACIYVWRRTLSKSSETPVPRRAAAAAAAAFDSPHRPPLLWNTKEAECYTFVCVCVSTNSPISEEVK